MEEADVVRIVESSVAKKNESPLASMKSILESSAKLQNTGPLSYISLNHKGPYCVMLRS